MAGKYKPYPAYKPSGVEWLADIPADWELVLGKRVFSNRREQALKDDQQLAASQAYGVIPQTLMMQLNNAKVMLALKGTESFRHVDVDDFVISLRSFEGGIEHSNYTGCVSPAYTVLRPNRKLVSRFFRYLMKSAQFISALQSTTDSLRDGKSITYQQFGMITLGIPSLLEQAQIAAFLDYETAKIDALIAKQQRLIELLEEKRQAVISHAVTKGLNPNAPMRPSGIDWLGDIPAHWEVKRLKHLSNIRYGIGEPPKYHIEGTPLIRATNIRSGQITAIGLVFVNPREIPMTRIVWLEEGDIVVVRSGATTGDSSIISADYANSIAGFDMVVRVNQNAPYFVAYALLSNYIKINQIDVEKTRAAQPHLNAEELGNCFILLPSEFEQAEIVNFISLKLVKIADLLTKAQSAIALLKERRTALISAAVTGKIDVRGWQPQENNSGEEILVGEAVGA